MDCVPHASIMSLLIELSEGVQGRCHDDYSAFWVFKFKRDGHVLEEVFKPGVLKIVHHVGRKKGIFGTFAYIGGPMVLFIIIISLLLLLSVFEM